MGTPSEVIQNRRRGPRMRRATGGFFSINLLFGLLLLFGFATCGCGWALVDGVVPPPVIQGDTHLGKVAMDESGNRYVTGSFSLERDFNPRTGTDIKKAGNSLYDVNSNGLTDAFVTRMNSDGGYAWTQTFGSNTTVYAGGVAVAGGTVFVTGYFNGANAGIGGLGPFSGPGSGGYNPSHAVFIMALDATTGAPRTAFGTGGVVITPGDFGRALVVANDSLYVAIGWYAATVLALDPVTGALRGGFGINGRQVFAGQSWASGPGACDPLCMAVAGDGTLYLGGYFEGNRYGLGGPGTWASQSNGDDAFILAMDGTTGQAKTGFGSGGLQVFTGTTSDFYGLASMTTTALAPSGGTLYVGGHFLASDAGIGSPGSSRNTGNGFDVFILSLDPDTGAPKPSFNGNGVQTFGGDRQASAACWDMCLSHGTIYVTGSLDDRFTYGFGGTGTISTDSGSDPAYVLAVVLAVDAATGLPQSNFGGGDGVVLMTSAHGDSIRAHQNTLSWLGGAGVGARFESGAALYPDIAKGLYGFLATLDPLTGIPPFTQRGPRSDFDGDGRADILLRHPSSGEVFLWLIR